MYQKTKIQAESDAPTKKTEGDAYEMDAMDRSPKKNSRGDRLMSVRNLKRFKAEMRKIGVNVIIDSKGKVLKGNLAAGYDNVSRTIYLREGTTRYEAFHESQHAKQHAEMGDAYNKQTRIEKEAHVRDQIMKNKDMFSERELNHAEAYQRSVEDPYGNWPPKDPETGLYKLD